jgi:hypothetical protein
MVPNEKMKSFIRQILIVISIHTIIFAIFIYAHQKTDLLYDISSQLPYIFLFCLVPIIFGFILLTRYVRQGAIVLLGILPAALVNNIASRFTGLPPFVMQEPALIWKVLYEGAFGLILVSEVVGSWLTFKLLQEIHKKIDLLAENSNNKVIAAKGSKSESYTKRIARKKKRH